jgi:hypothetical protein
MKSISSFLATCLVAAAAQAATPAELLAGYRTQAAAETAGFQPDADRGSAFYWRKFGVSEQMSSCSSCHGARADHAGHHVVTDKIIKPLAPRGNAARFTDPAKVEKWFGRNCTEVVGRECTAAEKADFVAFLMLVQ